MTQPAENVGHLIAGASPRLGELRARSQAFAALAARVRALLPVAEAQHVTGLVHCDKALVLLVDSSAWCARLRYRAHALRPALSQVLGQELEEVRVRVVPRGARR